LHFASSNISIIGPSSINPAVKDAERLARKVRRGYGEHAAGEWKEFKQFITSDALKEHKLMEGSGKRKDWVKASSKIAATACINNHLYLSF
jgi:hypothetical protein